MRTDEIEVRGRLIQELLEDTFHNLFIRYIYVGIIEIEKLTLIIKSLIVVVEEKKIIQSHVKYGNQVFFNVFFS